MKKTNRIIAAAILSALAFLTGCGNRAEPIDLPPDAAVTGIDIVTMAGEEITVTEPGKIEAVMSVLRAAEPTRTPSVNDCPTNVTAYGTLSIHDGDRSTVLYYYEKSGRQYIEQPYRGIYRTEDCPEDLLR